jgi:hypothetical protein
MVQWVAYLVKYYNIPLELVVNTNKIGIQLMPKWKTKMRKKEEAKSVAVVGQEDKRQVAMAISSSSTCDMFLFQVTSTRTTRKNLPLMNLRHRLCKDARWHITNPSNHWSNLIT